VNYIRNCRLSCSQLNTPFLDSTAAVAPIFDRQVPLGAAVTPGVFAGLTLPMHHSDRRVHI
jgi:hypothetical protein